MPPTVQGREVVRVLGAARPGQWTGEALARVVEWQLAHPEGTKEAAEAWLRAEHAAGKIRIEDASGAGPSKRGKEAGADGKTKKVKR